MRLLHLQSPARMLPVARWRHVYTLIISLAMWAVLIAIVWLLCR